MTKIRLACSSALLAAGFALLWFVHCMIFAYEYGKAALTQSSPTSAKAVWNSIAQRERVAFVDNGYAHGLAVRDAQRLLRYLPPVLK